MKLSIGILECLRGIIFSEKNLFEEKIMARFWKLTVFPVIIVADFDLILSVKG